MDATIRVKIPSTGKAKRVLHLPEEKEMPFVPVGEYVQFYVPTFEVLSMLMVEY